MPVLVSCALNTTLIPETANDVETIQSDKCMPPIYGEGFSYPIAADHENLPYPGLDMLVPPPSPWEVEASLPEFAGLTNWERRDLGVIQTRRIDSYYEIWIHISQGLEKQGYLAIYRTDTKEWKVIPEQIDTLILDKNGSLWGSHSGYFGYASAPFDSRVLSKFDELTNTFIPVKEVQNLAAVVEKGGSQYYSQVLLDEDGMFWILVPVDGIYKYDPNSGEMKKYFDLPAAFRDAKIAPHGDIYVLVNNMYYQDGEERFDYILKYYNTKTGKNSEFALAYYLEPYPKPFTLLVDHQGRIWLDNIAFIDDGTLYQIQRSPLFISPISEAYNDYRYKRADVILESSDGRIWFLHRNNGIISLNPDKDEWCWFTTYQSNIVEDSNHNLWMIADGKLYKLPLGEQ